MRKILSKYKHDAYEYDVILLLFPGVVALI